MKNYIEIGQLVWYLDRMWAHPAKITRIQISIDTNSGKMVSYELNGNWIPECFVFTDKQKLKDAIINAIDNNSPKDV